MTDPISSAQGAVTGNILAVLPCLNEEAYLEALVHKLVKNNQSLPLCIVIADGNSTDRTPEIAKQLAAQYQNVFYLRNPKRLQSAAVNLAAAGYGGAARLLIRLDVHSDYPDNYCQILVTEAEATNAASVVVAMNTIGKAGFQSAVAAAQNSKLGNGGSAHRNNTDGAWVDHGHHALMRIDAFRAVGGYDESFSHNEDAELDIRLAKAGYKIWLTGKTSLIYYPRSAPLPLFRQYFNFGQGRARTIIKHHIIPKLRQMVPAAVLPAVVLALLTPFFPIAALPLLAWAGICLGYGAKLGSIATGFAAMIMHFGWSLGFWTGIPKAWRSFHA